MLIYPQNWFLWLRWGWCPTPTNAPRVGAPQAPPLHSDITWGASVASWISVAIRQLGLGAPFAQVKRSSRYLLPMHNSFAHYVSPASPPRDFSGSSRAWSSSSVSSSYACIPYLRACTIWVCKNSKSHTGEVWCSWSFDA